MTTSLTVQNIFSPILPYIALISVFYLTDGAARIFLRFLSFSIQAGMGDNRHCEKESKCDGVPERIALKILGRIRV